MQLASRHGWAVGDDWLSKIHGELRCTYDLVKRDLSASLVPGTLIATSGALAANVSLVPVIAKAILYFSAYIYVFCLANQLVGLDEDRLNKPDRPLPSGRWSMVDARRRWLFGMVCFPAISASLGEWKLMLWAIGWEIILVVYNFAGWHRHWFSKNLGFIASGTFVLLGAGWQLSDHFSRDTWEWIIFISIVFGWTLHLQDFRDVKGDLAADRRTLPIVIGDVRARFIVAMSIALIPVAGHVTIFRHVGWIGRVVEVVLAATNCFVAWRLWAKRSPRDDHATYMAHTYWFCAVTAAVGVVVRFGH